MTSHINISFFCHVIRKCEIKYLFVVCCLLFVVCCLLFVVCCLLFVVCCLLFVVCCLLFVVCCLLFVVCCLLFVVCCLLFVVCCLLFVVCCLLFVVCNWLIDFAPATTHESQLPGYVQCPAIFERKNCVSIVRVHCMKTEEISQCKV